MLVLVAEGATHRPRRSWRPCPRANPAPPPLPATVTARFDECARRDASDGMACVTPHGRRPYTRPPACASRMRTHRLADGSRGARCRGEPDRVPVGATILVTTCRHSRSRFFAGSSRHQRGEGHGTEPSRGAGIDAGGAGEPGRPARHRRRRAGAVLRRREAPMAPPARASDSRPTLPRFLANVRYDDLPPEARARSRARRARLGRLRARWQHASHRRRVAGRPSRRSARCRWRRCWAERGTQAQSAGCRRGERPDGPRARLRRHASRRRDPAHEYRHTAGAVRARRAAAIIGPRPHRWPSPRRSKPASASDRPRRATISEAGT